MTEVNPHDWAQQYFLAPMPLTGDRVVAWWDVGADWAVVLIDGEPWFRGHESDIEFDELLNALGIQFTAYVPDQHFRYSDAMRRGPKDVEGFRQFARYVRNRGRGGVVTSWDRQSS